MRKSFESGQAIVVVLLSLSVVLTVVLFTLSRSVSDISTTTQQSDSVRAFSAAEAGVENALITGEGATNVNIGNASYSVNVVSGGSLTYNHQTPLSSGETVTLWFVSHDADGELVCSANKPCFSGTDLNICWGVPGGVIDGLTPALEVSIYYQTVRDFTDFSGVKIVRGAYDPYVVRSPANSFEQSVTNGCTIDGKSYAFKKTINLSDLGSNTNALLFAKARMLYNSSPQPIGFSAGSPFPSQGLEITSRGTSGTEGGTVSNRSVYVFQSWADYPFSGFSLFYPNGTVNIQ